MTAAQILALVQLVATTADALKTPIANLLAFIGAAATDSGDDKKLSADAEGWLALIAQTAAERDRTEPAAIQAPAGDAPQA